MAGASCQPAVHTNIGHSPPTAYVRSRTDAKTKKIKNRDVCKQSRLS